MRTSFGGRVMPRFRCDQVLRGDWIRTKPPTMELNSSTITSIIIEDCWTERGEWCHTATRLNLPAHCNSSPNCNTSVRGLDCSISRIARSWHFGSLATRQLSTARCFFLSKQLPHTTYVSQELEEGDIGNVLSQANDPTGPGYLLWEPVAEGDAALRILGQRSVFVIGRPLIDGRHVHAIVVDATEKEALREELAQLDISEGTIFRDLVGFCEMERADVPYVPPAMAGTYLRRGNSAFERGEYSEAIDAYGKCLDRGGHAAETYFLRGNANAAAKHYRNAVDDYEKALQSPDLTEGEGASTHHPWYYFAIIFNRGNMWACLAEYDKAVEDYRQVSGIDPKFTASHFNRGNAHFMQQQFEDAVDCYDEVIALVPESATALHNKALALVLLGNLESAETCYMKIQDVAELEINTLEPLRELQGFLAGLTDSRLRVVTNPQGNSAKVSHPNYKGGRRAALFKGIHGNIGNVGGRNLPGGEGFEGGTAVLAYVEQNISKPLI